MHSPSPWRALRELTDVILHWHPDLPHPLRGASNGERIWLSSDMTQVERRCVLAHELEHVRRRHSGCQNDAVERQVQAATARYLLPDAHLVAEALAWARCHLEEAADVLWVTPRVLGHRLDPRHLHPAERALIKRRLDALEEPA